MIHVDYPYRLVGIADNVGATLYVGCAIRWRTIASKVATIQHNKMVQKSNRRLIT